MFSLADMRIIICPPEMLSMFEFRGLEGVFSAVFDGNYSAMQEVVVDGDQRWISRLQELRLW